MTTPPTKAPIAAKKKGKKTSESKNLQQEIPSPASAQADEPLLVSDTTAWPLEPENPAQSKSERSQSATPQKDSSTSTAQGLAISLLEPANTTQAPSPSMSPYAHRDSTQLLANNLSSTASPAGASGLSFSSSVVQLIAGYAVGSAIKPSAQSSTAQSSTATARDTQAPVFTEGASKTVNFAENGSGKVYSPVATDNIAVGHYELAGGADDGLFNIDAVTGALTFKTPPNFEAPASAAVSNAYTVKIKAFDAAGNSATQTITVNVTDVNDNAPVFTSGASASVNENVAANTIIYTPATTDADVTPVNKAVVYSLKDGGDKASLSINSSTGEVTLLGSPNYGTKSSYSFTVVATNGSLVVEKPVLVSVNQVQTLSGNIIAGPVLSNPGNDLVVDAYDAQGVLLGSAAVKADGSYSLSVARRDTVLLRVHDKDQSNSSVPTYMDEATRTSKAFTELLAVVDMSGQASTLTTNITPLTQVAAIKAGASVGSRAAPADAQAVKQANQSVGLLFLGDANLLSAAPVTTVDTQGQTQTGADPYGVVLHTISQLESSSNQSTSQVTQTLAQGVQSSNNGDRSLSTAVKSLLGATVDTIKGVNPTLSMVGDTVKSNFETSVSASEIGATTTPTGAPRINAVALTAATGAQNNTLNAGDVLTATVTFDQSVTVSGLPYLTLNIGGVRVLARYDSGSGTSALNFRYTIAQDLNDANGVSLPANGVRLNGGTIKADSLDASLVYKAVADNASYMVDTMAPVAALNLTLKNDSSDGKTKNDGITNDPSVKLQDKPVPEAGATVEYRIQKAGGAFSNWSSTYTAPPTDGSADGSYTVQVRQVDAAGNIGPSRALNFILDTTPPEVPLAALDSLVDSSKSRGFTVQSGAQVQVYVGGSNVPLSSELMLAKFSVTQRDGMDAYSANAGAFDGTLAFRVSATWTNEVGNQGTNSLQVSKPLFAPSGVSNPLELFAKSNAEALVKGSYDDGFYVTEGASVSIKIGGVPLSAADVQAKFTQDSADGLTSYIAIADAFTGNELAITVDATLSNASGTYTQHLDLLPIDSTPPPSKTVTLLPGFANGATASKALSLGGVATLIPDAGVTTMVELISINNLDDPIVKTFTGDGIHPVTLVLTQADLAVLGEASVSFDVIVKDAAGNLTYTYGGDNPKLELDMTAPTLRTVAPKVTSSTLAGGAGNSLGETVALTLSFSEAVYGLRGNALNSTVFKVNDVGVEAKWSGTDGGTTRTLTYTIAAGQNGQASIDEAALKAALVAGLTDKAGNAFAYTANNGVIPNIDITPLAVVDSVAPTASLTAGTGVNTGNATVSSSEAGTAYLVKTGGVGAVTVTTVASITGAADGKWNSVAVAANSNTSLSLAGLEDGTYSLYTVDAAGNLSAAASSTYTVTSANRAPTGTVTISGTPTQGQTLTASNTLADADGLGTIGYQWQASADGGSTWTNIAGATANTLTLTQAHVGKKLQVAASYTDGRGAPESVASAATSNVANVNDAPTGHVTISGTAQQGQTLSALNDLADADGLGTVTYQWQTSTDGGSTWTSIAGATTSSLSLAQAQVGKAVRVLASYTDGWGTAESVASGATGAVVSGNQTLSGSVIAGPVLSNPGNDLVVEAYDAQGVLLGSAPVNADGSYSLSIARRGTVLLRVYDKEPNDSDVPTYMDEATRTSKAFTELLAVVDMGAQGATVTTNITPLTQVAAIKAGASVGSRAAPADAQAVQQANQSVGLLFLGDADLLGASPVTTVNKQGQIQIGADIYGLVLHTISQMESGASQSTSQVTQTLAKGIEGANTGDRNLSTAVQSTLAATVDTVKGVNPTLVSVGDAAKTNFQTPVSASEIGATTTPTGAPRINAVALTAATGAQNNTLNAGDVLTATVTFDQSVTVSGLPYLTLNIGGVRVLARYSSGSGTSALNFKYTIAQDLNDANGVSLPANGVRLNGGTIKAGSLDASLVYKAVADNASYMVDTAPPDPLEPSLSNDASNGSRITNDPSLTLTGVREPGAVPEYRIQKGDAPFSAWSSTYALATLPTDHSADGDYTVEVRQKDRAGNLSSSRSTYFMLDTTPPVVSLVEVVNTNDSSKSEGFRVTSGATVQVYLDGSTVALTADEMSAKFTFTDLGDIDSYSVKEGAFAASGQNFRITASLRDDATNEGTATLVGTHPFYWAPLVPEPLQLHEYGPKAGSGNTFSNAFSVTTAATVVIKIGGVPQTASQISAKLTKSNDAVSGETFYFAKAGQFKGDEVVTVDATLTKDNQTYTKHLDVRPIDTTVPAAAVLTLKPAVVNGATASEATDAGGILSFTAEQGANVVISITGYSAGSALKKLVGNGSVPVPVVLTQKELASFSEGKISFDVTVTDPASNAIHTWPSSNPTVNLDRIAPTLSTVAPKLSSSTLAGTPGDSMGETVALQLTFDSSVVGLASGVNRSIFLLDGVGVPARWSGSGATRTLAYTVDAGQNGQLSVDETALKSALVAGIADAAGNAFTYTANNGVIANIDSTPLAVVSTNAPSSSTAFSLWQEAELAAQGDTSKNVQALNQYSQEIFRQIDPTSRDGSANQSDSAKRLAQWVDPVGGTDNLSAKSFAAGFSITGKAAPGAQATIRFRLDNDRTTGGDGEGAQVFTLGNNANGVTTTYDNVTGEWTMSFAANSTALKQATQNVYGSGIHQLVVDTNGNGSKDAGEASRLFLVAAGTPSSTDTGTAAQNYSVQDRLTGDVFVYYYGDPDGAGVAIKTLLDKGDTATGTQFATDRDGDSSDADYYNLNVSALAATALPVVTADNTALHLVSNIGARVWDFHVTRTQTAQTFADAQSQAADHAALGSNTSRQISLQELVALYAANFGGDTPGSTTSHIAGPIQALSNANIKATTPAQDNRPGDWLAGVWSTAPTPSGHAYLDLLQGLIYDQSNSTLKTGVFVV